MRPGKRLQRHTVKTGDFAQHGLNAVKKLKSAWDGFNRLHRVQVGKPWVPSGDLIDPRVVFHRAAAQRVEAGVDPVIDVAEVREVADDLKFAYLWKVQRGALTTQHFRNVYSRRVCFRNVATDASGAGLVEDESRFWNAFGARCSHS